MVLDVGIFPDYPFRGPFLLQCFRWCQVLMVKVGVESDGVERGMGEVAGRGRGFGTQGLVQGLSPF